MSPTADRRRATAHRFSGKMKPALPKPEGGADKAMCRFSVIEAAVLAFLLAVLSSPPSLAQISPQSLAVKDLTDNPSEFQGRLITVRGPLTTLKNDEWAIYDVFFRYVSVVLRSTPEAAPELDLTSASKLSELARHAGQPGMLEATFTGRFEWSGVSCRPGAAECRGPFGKSRTTMRIVLRHVTDVSHRPLPRK